MHSPFRFLSLMTVALVSIGCLTPATKTPSSRRSPELAPKLGSETRESASTSGLARSERPQATPKLDFIRRLNQDNPPELGPAEQELMENTAKLLSPTDIDRAVLTWGTVRLVMQMQSEAKIYRETDLFTSPSLTEDNDHPSGSFPTVEEELQKYNLDLLEEVRHNPLLQSIHFHSLLIRATAKDKPAYRKNIVDLCMTKLKEWARFHQLASSAATDKSAPLSGQVSEEHDSVASIKGADLTLVEAERLAERKQYQDALKLAQRISEKNPLYLSAQDKIKSISNMAVIDLRRKAASAFQNALPVNDLRIKQSYLQEAKEHLESALNNYPKAEDLGKIRENLAVISRDLQDIDAQLGSENEEQQ